MISKNALAELLQPVKKDAKRAGKHESALTYLLAYRSALCADAEGWPLYDRYLNTTISELGRYHGFEIPRQGEHRNCFGRNTRLVRYFLEEKEREKAFKVANLKREARGANPLSEKDFLANDSK